MNNLKLQIHKRDTYETSKHSESMNIPGCSEDDGYTHRVQESLATEYSKSFDYLPLKYPVNLILHLV